MDQALKNAQAESKHKNPDSGDFQYYSRVAAGAASTRKTLEFFKDLTSGMTNMKMSSMIEPGYSFDVKAILVNIFNSDGSPFFFQGGASPSVYPLNLLAATGFFSLVKSERTIYEVPFSRLFPQIDYMDGGTPSSNLCATMALYSTTVRGRIKLRKPITLVGGKNFQGFVDVTTPAAARGYSATLTIIEVILDGTRLRMA